MLLKVLKKEKPTDNEKKRAWNPDYFQHIFFGMEWSRVPLYHSKEWAPFEVRIVWTVMITMHEHLLRVGEVVEQRVDTQTCRVDDGHAAASLSGPATSKFRSWIPAHRTRHGGP